ncbi:alcohol dehydrogenase catalytic domain-containing protein [Nonomuraea sp. NPDC005650]|uniref:zinc-dependent alcohol dehydrogenase n=1 Tax=Nonomuraea sp. NPDC005650 TaxID=3157045 RepID=UPI0033B360FD
MKAVRAVPPGVKVVQVDEPQGDAELIKVNAVGICASDWNYIRRGSGQILGHEISGVASDGTPVVVEAVFGCGECRWCEQGRFNLCRLAGSDILGLTTPGGMSEYFRVPRTSLVPIPEELPAEDACLAEPGAVAWHAVRKTEITADTRVAVVGGGVIGLFAVLAAQAQGAAEVSLEARYPHQIEAGDRFGATRPSGDYDVVIEASGSESGLARAFELARPLGVVCSVSVYPPDITWPYRVSFLKEVRLIPSIAYDRHDNGVSELAHVMAMLAARPEIAQALITHRFEMDEAERAFQVAAQRKGAFRVVVHP